MGIISLFAGAILFFASITYGLLNLQTDDIDLIIRRHKYVKAGVYTSWIFIVIGIGILVIKRVIK